MNLGWLTQRCEERTALTNEGIACPSSEISLSVSTCTPKKKKGAHITTASMPDTTASMLLDTNLCSGSAIDVDRGRNRRCQGVRQTDMSDPSLLATL